MVPTLHGQTSKSTGALDLDMEVHSTDSPGADGTVVTRETPTYSPSC